MQPLRLVSAVEQVAAHLREEMRRGSLTGAMPGVQRLAAELGVSPKTMAAALRQLSHEGWVVGHGPRRKRRVGLAGGGATPRPLRIALMAYEPVDITEGYVIELRHLLMEAGHTAFFTEKSLMELGMNVARIDRLFRRTEADAWVLAAGSREVLEWFCAQSVPAFALFGRRAGLPIAAAGPDKPPAYAAAARQLIDLGHRRIVLVARQVRRLPELGRSERAFLNELEAHGVPVSDYNLPDWEETGEGLQHLLVELFRVTPPTAMIIDETPLFAAVQQFLAGRGIRVPGQVSLICTDADRTFAWCRPSIAHIRWDSGPIVRRIVRWAATVSRGGRDVKQTLTEAEFIAGGTIGPAAAG